MAEDFESEFKANFAFFRVRVAAYLDFVCGMPVMCRDLYFCVLASLFFAKGNHGSGPVQDRILSLFSKIRDVRQYQGWDNDRWSIMVEGALLWFCVDWVSNLTFDATTVCLCFFHCNSDFHCCFQEMTGKESQFELMAQYLVKYPFDNWAEEYQNTNQSWLWAKNSEDVRAHAFVLFNRFWPKLKMTDILLDYADERIMFVLFCGLGVDCCVFLFRAELSLSQPVSEAG